MVFDKITSHDKEAMSITNHAEHQKNSGLRVFPGESGTFWIEHETSAMVRIPHFHLVPPTPHEIRQVLWKGRVAIASYLMEPDEHHPANTWLYICMDHAYTLEKLHANGRRDVRRGLRELSITPLTSEQVLAHGVQAFIDTRYRNGLDDGTPAKFLQWFTALARMPEVVYLGAWKEDHLAAFMTITEVDDWAEIACFSMNALRRYTPNDALVFSALSHYLAERQCRLVSYGLSSIQTKSNATGLHKFKLKLGFEARPVHRAFVPHPILRPFINRLTLWGVSTMLHFRPEDRRLKKAEGALKYIFGDAYMSGETEKDTNSISF